MPRRPQPLRIAIDTGGTFTDCVWIDAGRLRMLKVFSTPADPSQAIVEALRKVAHEGELVLLHGTTVGTNTLLEHKGARTALVTTKGFEDAIALASRTPPPPSSPRKASKTPSKSDARPAPNSTTSSSTASNRSSPKISASA